MKLKTGLVMLCWLALSMAAQASGRGLTLGDYRSLTQRAPATVEMLLGAMYQTAAYAQASLDHPETCFTPVPLPASELEAMIATELDSPHNSLGRAYVETDPLALILVNALRRENVCR